MRSTIERALMELGIRQHFVRLVTREDVRLAKPHPEGWQLIEDGTPSEQFHSSAIAATTPAPPKLSA